MSRRTEALVRQDTFDEPAPSPASSAQRACDEPEYPRTPRRQEQPVAIIRIARLWPGAERAAAAALPTVTPIDLNPNTDSLEAFSSEAVVVPIASAKPAPPLAVVRPETPAIAPMRNWRNPQPALRWVGVMVLGLAAVAGGAWTYQIRAAAAPGTGTLTVQTSPSGLPVAIDGKSAGVTPLTMTLAPASYVVRVGEGDQRRELTINLVAGSSILQHLEIAAPLPASAAITTGALTIQTEPSGQTVSIDGIDRGPSPLTVDELSAGDHNVTVRSARGTVRRTVAVKAGETVSLLIAPTAPTAPAPGWLSVQSSSRLELREAGKLLGTTETEQIMLPAGTHDIELVNDAIGYRARRQIEVVPNQTTTVPVELPYGAISINAQPWAEVWMNGERVGETPIANLSRRVGTYEVVFRHPELGERKETITVTLRQPARLGVDMRSK